MKLADGRIRKEILRYALRQCVGHGSYTLDIWKSFQIIRQPLFCHRIRVRIDQKHHIASAELCGDLLIIRVHLSSRSTAHSAVSVLEIVHLLSYISRRGNEKHRRQNQITDAVHAPSKPCKIREEGTMFRLIIPFGKFQDHGRHEQYHGQKAEDDTLCQNQAHIETDVEFHGNQGQETNYGGQAAGENGVDGLFNRLDDCFLLGKSGISPVHVGIQQENGIVHGCCQLQDNGYVIRQEGDGSNEYVGSLI